MKYYQFNKNIDYDSSNELLKFLNENTETDITIYLACNGGSIGSAFSLKDAIEKHGKITLVAYICIGSAAFSLFYTVDCKKEILPFTRGMWHLGQWDISMDCRGKAYHTEDEFIRNDIQTRDKEYIQYICDLVGMKKKDIKTVMEAEEAWFNAEQLQEFLKTSQEKLHPKK